MSSAVDPPRPAPAHVRKRPDDRADLGVHRDLNVRVGSSGNAKVEDLGLARLSTRMLLGFRSRWTIPFWCACSTASQIRANSSSRSRVPRRFSATARRPACPGRAPSRSTAARCAPHSRCRPHRSARSRDAGASPGSGLLLEAPQRPPRREADPDHLERDDRRGFFLLGLVNRAHPAFADDTQDAITADLRGGGDGGRGQRAGAGDGWMFFVGRPASPSGGLLDIRATLFQYSVSVPKEAFRPLPRVKRASRPRRRPGGNTEPASIISSRYRMDDRKRFWA